MAAVSVRMCYSGNAAGCMPITTRTVPMPSASLDPPAEPLPRGLTDPELDPVFWPPARVGTASAWWGHVPFLHWLVVSARPRLAVELGTHHGVSFAALCEAMWRSGSPGRCVAIDTWTGDRHSGFYDESVLRDLAAFVEARYGAFAELVRLTFDDALPYFADGSIDLLHIDGLHTEEAVRHDFESWRPKLSDRAVVLLHDITVRRDDFGVWKLWADLERAHPSFDFFHGHGLGLAAVGPRAPEPVRALCALDRAAALAVRRRFAHLGARWIAADAARSAQQTIARLRQRTADLAAELERRTADLAAELERRTADRDGARGRLAERDAALAEQAARLADERARLAAQARRLGEHEAERARLAASLAEQAEALGQQAAALDAERRRTAEERRRAEDLRRQNADQLAQIADLHVEIVDLEAERERAALLSGAQFQLIAELEAARAAQVAPIAGASGPAGWAGAFRAFRSRRGEAAMRTGPAPVDPDRLSDADLIAASGFFDEAAYAGRSEAQAARMSAVAHYVAQGEAAGLAPSRRFDPGFYRDRHDDLDGFDGCLLAHYLRHGRAEHRAVVPLAASVSCPTARIDPRRETIVVAVHEATRTGAPIVAWNLVRELEIRHNVVVVLKAGGPIAPAFREAASATLVLPEDAAWHDAEARALADLIVRTYAPAYLIANSVETRAFVPAFERAGVPAVALVHEFSIHARPRGTLAALFRAATEVVFPARLVAEAALADYPALARRDVRILPQGLCRPPTVTTPAGPPGDGPAYALAPVLAEPLPDEDGTLLVVGIGTIIPRKGVEFFIGVAAAVARRRPARPIRFAWEGLCTAFDEPYLDSLKEQVTRSGLTGSFRFLGQLPDLAPLYARAGITLLSSRLDPMPNVAIESAAHGIPVVCFDQASGMAELMTQDAALRDLVVPYLDVAAAADAVVALADRPDRRAAAGEAMRALAARHFDLPAYVAALDALGQGAARLARQRERDRAVIAARRAFNADLYAGCRGTDAGDMLDDYLAASRLSRPRSRPRTGPYLRRPLEGFHPLVYAEDSPQFAEAEGEDPLAHFARTGFPDGRWRHDVIRPSAASSGARGLRVAVHGHFYYPDLLPDFLRRLRRNATPVDLFVTTSSAGVDAVTDVLRRLAVPQASVRAVPNRGRDIGPLLTELGRAELDGYDVIGHVHGKKTRHADPALGALWRTVLWENLIGGTHAMLDAVCRAFEADGRLGLVFPEDPHLADWDDNRGLAEALARRMGLADPLPNHFDFPLGTMFWARPAALGPLFDLGLGWDDYPPEPLPIDGTLLHALERLVPFAAARAGYGFATTFVETALR